MARQFRPVDRDAEMLLPPNMLDWVPEGHAVRVVISTVERLATRDLARLLVPPAPRGSAAGPARYDPVMLLTVWMYAYLRGVLSTRAVEDRCRYDATFRVACGREVPDHTTFARFRQHLLAQDHLAGDLFYQVLHVCACAGLGRLARGSRRRGEDRRERVEGGQPDRGRAAQARRAGPGRRPEGRRPVTRRTSRRCRARTCCSAGRPRPDPRSRAGRVAACLADLQKSWRPAAAAAAAVREQGRAYLEALEAGTAAGPRPRSRSPRGRVRLEQAHRDAAGPIDDWHARRAAGAGSRLGRRPVAPPRPPRSAQRPRPAGGPAGPPLKRRPPGTGGPPAPAQRHRPGLPAAASPRRRVHPGLQLPGRRLR